MKRSVLAGVILAMVVSASAPAGQWEAVGALGTYFPSDDLWESYTIGGEVKGAYWITPQWGVALAAGLVEWDMDQTEAISDIVSLGLSGEVLYVPMGVSILARLEADKKSRLTVLLEGGVRYMFCHAKVEARRTTIIPGDDPDVESFEIDCDDGIVGRLGAGIEWALDDSQQAAKLLLAGGYQFDLDKGEAEDDGWLGFSEDLSLEAFFVEIGLVIPIP
jgi:hypothetical protein